MTVIEFPTQLLKPLRSKASSKLGRASINKKNSRKSRSTQLPSTTRLGEATATMLQVREDARSMPLADLKKAYPATYQSWHAMKYDRAKKHGAIIAPEFATFPGFLANVGPRRNRILTLDRKDPSNPVYGPSLCEWRDKRDQANNRRTSIKLPHPVTGDPSPLPEVAEAQGVKPDTLRKRLREGFTPAQAVEGSRTASPPLIDPHRNPKARWPWPLTAEQRSYWEKIYHEGRKEISSSSGYEFRFEYALRHLRNLIPRIGEELQALRDQWGRDEPNEAEAAIYLPRDALSEKLKERLADLEAAWPQWAEDIRGHRRVQVSKAYDSEW